MLLPLEQSLIFEKNGDKKNLVKFFYFRYGKIIFALFNKIEVLHVSLISIHIRYFSLERSLFRLVKSLGNRNSDIQDRLEDLLKIIFKVLYYLRGNGRRFWIGRTSGSA